MKPATKKAFNMAFWLAAILLLVPVAVHFASGVEMTVDEFALKLVRSIVAFLFIFFGVQVWESWKSPEGKGPIAGSDIKEPTITKLVEPEYRTDTLEMTNQENSTFENPAPKMTKEIEHNNVSAAKLFCTQCGIQNLTIARFCWKCGHAMHRGEGLR